MITLIFRWIPSKQRRFRRSRYDFVPLNRHVLTIDHTFQHFGISDELNLTIKKRGAPPLGGGEIIFSCPLIRQLQSIYLVEEGFIKRIRYDCRQQLSRNNLTNPIDCRGTAYSTRVSPQTSNRIVECCRGVFNKLLPDVYIYSDHYKGAESGQSPGFALSLVAETTSGILLGADGAASAGDLPEDVATIASHALCEEIKQGGCIDSTNQSLVLLFMALSPPSVSKVRVGRLTPYTCVYSCENSMILTTLLCTVSSICDIFAIFWASPSKLRRIERQKQSFYRVAA